MHENSSGSICFRNDFFFPVDENQREKLLQFGKVFSRFRTRSDFPVWLNHEIDYSHSFLLLFFGISWNIFHLNIDTSMSLPHSELHRLNFSIISFGVCWFSEQENKLSLFDTLLLLYKFFFVRILDRKWWMQWYVCSLQLTMSVALTNGNIKPYNSIAPFFVRWINKYYTKYKNEQQPSFIWLQ